MLLLSSLSWGWLVGGGLVGEGDCLLMRSASVDEFFEKLEKNTDNGKKLVSWHGELVPPPSHPQPPILSPCIMQISYPSSLFFPPLRVIYIPTLVPGIIAGHQ